MAKEVIKNPFEVIDAMFEIAPVGSYGVYDKTHSQYEKVTDKEKQRNFFIINRRLAIKFPIQALKLSFNGINPIYAIDSWYQITSKIASKEMKKPKWLWLKINKEKEEKKFKISEEVKEFYINDNQISDKEFYTALKFNQSEMLTELKKIEKHLELIKKIKKNG